MPRAAVGSSCMATDRDRLTTFFYLLTRGHDERPGVGWGIVEDIIADCLPYESSRVCVRKGAETLAREMVDRLLGPKAADDTSDLQRCETLRAAAEMLTRVRGFFGSDAAEEISEMVDRCNLAAMGVAYVGDREISPPRARVLAVGAFQVAAWTERGGVQEPGQKLVLCTMPEDDALALAGDTIAPTAEPDPTTVLVRHGWTTVDGKVWQRGLNPPAAFIENGAVTMGRGPAISPDELIAFAALARESNP